MLALASCGGGGGGGGSTVEVNYAPASLNGRKLIFQDPSVPVSTSYAYAPGTYSTAGDSGPYTYARDTVLHKATVVNNSTTTNVTSTYDLTFSNATQGTYTVKKTSPGGTVTESSSFTIQ